VLAGALRRAPPPRYLAFAALGLCLVLLWLSGRAAVALARPDPGNITQRWQVPTVVERLTRHDRFAYPAHAAFAATLRAVGAPPEAEAVQWLKAAVHARGAEEAAAVRAGLAAARSRAAEPGQFDAAFRQIVARAPAEMRQRAAARVPGLPYVG
jgi:hypothetical protein